MKKVLSLLLVVMMTLSLATTGFAAAGNVRVNLDKTEYEAGDTIVATIDSLEKDISTDGFNLAYDASKVTFVGIQYLKTDGTYANLTRAGQIKVTREWEPGDEETVSFQVAENNATDNCVAFGFAGTDSSKILEVKGIVKISFTVKADATGDIVFTMNENSAGGTGYKGVADTKTVTEKAAPAPSNPEINADNNAAVEDANDAKTWAVAVDANYVAAGDKLIATLTNSNFTGEDATQVVELTVGDDVTGGADWAFNLKVRFKDVANRAATTLAIAKAN